MKKLRKGLACLLAMVMMITAFPVGVLAVSNGKAMQLGTEALNTNVNTTDSAVVYYGLDKDDNPYSYRVIGYGKDNGVVTSASNENTATLLATGRYGSYVTFSANNSNEYSRSNLRTEIEDAASKLTDGEKAAVAERTLETGSFTYNAPYTDGIAGDDVENALLWPLSTQEAYYVAESVRQMYPGSPQGQANYWWLRSPGDTDIIAAYVYGTGDINHIGYYVDSTYSVRPAFNLNLNSVLFTSAAEGGKSSGAVGADALTEIADYSGSAWKLTLLDESRSDFAIGTTAVNGNTLTVAYEGAAEGENEYVSAAIVNANNEITYYGRLKNTASAGDASGTVDITLPDGFNSESDTLYLFSEQYNGDKKTDYASHMAAVAISEKAMQLGTEALNTNVNTTDSAVVYYGLDKDGNPYSYRVIGYGDNGVVTSASNENTATLLATGRYGGYVTFSDNNSNEYSESNLRTEIEDAASKLTDGEKAAVAKRTLKSGSYTYNAPYTDGIAGDAVENAILWPLSTQEAYYVAESVRQMYPGSPQWQASYWWLRSPGDYVYDAACVSRDGIIIIIGDFVNFTFSVRPAFNLNLNSVLFTSAAEGGKSSGAVGADALTEIADYSGSEWKLTLLDKEKHGDFSIETALVKDKTMTVSYSGAATGNNEYISAVVKDENDKITYYGKIKNISSAANASGTVDITLPADFDSSNDTVYVFNEQCNGDKITDYASELKAVEIEAVAQIGDAQYSTLNDAFAAAAKMTTYNGEAVSEENPVIIEVLCDFTLDKTVDLSGNPWNVKLTSADGGKYTITRNPETATQAMIMMCQQKPDECSLILENITLDGGATEDSPETNSILIAYGLVVLNDGAVLQYNKCNGQAGAIDLQRGKLILNDGCVIQNNTARSGGGGIYAWAECVMNGGTIQNNQTLNNSAYGGGIRVGNNASFTMNNGQIINNVSKSFGGGLYFSSNGDNQTVCLYGGEITGNKRGASTEDGEDDDVYAQFTSTLVIGGEINIGYVGFSNTTSKIIVASPLTNTNSEHLNISYVSAKNIPAVVVEKGENYGEGSLDKTKFNFTDNWTDYCNWLSQDGSQITLDNHSGGTDTCTQGAVCSNCGKVYGTKTGHSYIHHEEIAAECEEPGMAEYYTCKNCALLFDKDKNETTENALIINATGHSYVHYEAVSAKCEEPGMEEHYSCENCALLFDKDKNETTESALIISATGHSYVHQEAVSAKCEEPGMAEHYTCENCELLFDKDKNETTEKALTISATGHSYVHYEAVSAKCEEPGMEEYYTCKNCALLFDKDKNETTENALIINATGHSYVYHEAVSAECEKSGMKEYYSCKNCGLIFDENKEVTTPDDLTIDATGHTFLTEWQTDEENHWHECSCGAKTEEAAHTFAWITDKEAEIGVAGEKHEECTECGYAKAAVEIPALKAPEYPPVVEDTDGGKVTVTPENPQEGDEVTITTTPEDGKEVDKVVVTDENGKEITVTNNGDGTYTFTQPDGKVTVKVTFKAKETKPVTDEKSPQTGDDSNITLWLAVLLMAGVGLTGTTVYSRRKRKYSK